MTKNGKIKIKEVYLYYLVYSIIVIFGYGFLRWALDIKLQLIPIKNDIMGYWLPVGLVAFFLFILMRHRIKILKPGKTLGHGFYQFIMFIALFGPLFTSQEFLEKGTFGLTPINKVSEISQHHYQKYFDIKSFKVNADRASAFTTSEVRGRRSKTLNYYMYFVCPFESGNNTIWYGLEYSFTTYPSKSQSELNREWDEFIQNSIDDFNKHQFKKPKYFELVKYSDEKDAYLEAIKEKYSALEDNRHLILTPIKENFDGRLGNTIPWFFVWLILGNLIVFGLMMIPEVGVDNRLLKKIKEDRVDEDDGLTDFLTYLNPFGEYKGTAILLDINVIVFIAMLFLGIDIVNPSAKDLLEFGGNRRVEVINGEYWRLLSSIFVHGGILHILFNSVGLIIAGIFLESFMKTWRLLITYLIAGIGASLTSIYWNDNIVSVGSSGAIFGLFGVLIAFNIFNVYSKNMRKSLWVFLTLYVGVNLIIGLLSQGIDNAAHIGGLISGFIIGLLFSQLVKKELNNF